MFLYLSNFTVISYILRSIFGVYVCMYVYGVAEKVN